MDQHRQVLLRDPVPRDSDALPPAGGQRPYTPQCWPQLLSAFTDYPRVLLTVVLLLLSILIFTVVCMILLVQVKEQLETLDSRSSHSVNHCGYGSYDLTSVQQAGSLFFTESTGNYRNQYSLRTCGAVEGSSCGGYYSNSQACVFSSQNDAYYNIASYDPLAGTWAATPSGGISYSSSNGGNCPQGSGSSSMIVYYQCDPNAVAPRLISVGHDNPPGCSYTFTVSTVAMCK